MAPKKRKTVRLDSKTEKVRSMLAFIGQSMLEKDMTTTVNITFDQPVCINPNDHIPLYRVGGRNIVITISPSQDGR